MKPTRTSHSERDSWSVLFTYWTPSIFQRRLRLFQIGSVVALTLVTISGVYGALSAQQGRLLLSQNYQTYHTLAQLGHMLPLLSEYRGRNLVHYKKTRAEIIRSLETLTEQSHMQGGDQMRSLSTLGELVHRLLTQMNDPRVEQGEVDATLGRIEVSLTALQAGQKKQIAQLESVAQQGRIAQYCLFALRVIVVTVALLFFIRWLHHVRRSQQEEEETLRNANAQLANLAEVDPLTGLRNRRTFEHHLGFEFDRCREQKWPLSLILVDVDHFKKFNDTFGHTLGDEALKVTAQVLSKAARPNDIVVRYGGEEFAILLPQTSASEACAVGERIRELMHKMEWPGRPCTASVGVSTLTHALQQPLDLINAADEALYSAKQNGRDKVMHIGELEEKEKSAAKAA